jgi:hypothetical protein
LKPVLQPGGSPGTHALNAWAAFTPQIHHMVGWSRPPCARRAKKNAACEQAAFHADLKNDRETIIQPAAC